jgi:hypothetical protein
VTAPRPRRLIVVVVATSDVPRAREALRAAVGLSLRGDRIHVVVPAFATGVGRGGTPAQLAIATLAELGHRVTAPAEPDEVAEAVRAADAVEVWS